MKIFILINKSMFRFFFINTYTFFLLIIIIIIVKSINNLVNDKIIVYETTELIKK